MIIAIINALYEVSKKFIRSLSFRYNDWLTCMKELLPKSLDMNHIIST